jgi:hypothetical protein
LDPAFWQHARCAEMNMTSGASRPLIMVRVSFPLSRPVFQQGGLSLGLIEATRSALLERFHKAHAPIGTQRGPVSRQGAAD